MATYPGAVKTFTTKSDGAGNKIFAAHVNDLQDEVNAIEDGLLNGTAPLNSSRITAPALQISAGSTFAGTVTMNDTVTIKELMVTVSPPNAILQNSANIGIANNVLTALNFDTHIQLSTSAMHSTAVNSSRLIAASSGFYLITGHVVWNANSSGIRQLQIVFNDATAIARVSVEASANHSTPYMEITKLYPLNANDYVTLRAYQLSGSTASIGANGVESPIFSMMKIR